MVEDDKELEALAKIFAELMEDVDRRTYVIADKCNEREKKEFMEVIF